MGKSTTVWLTVVCCLSQFIQTVYGSIVNIALPDIAKQLDAGMGELQWLVSAYIVTLAALLTFSGTLADRFGRKRILMLGNVILICGAVVCALSDSVGMLIAGRVLQGVGSAMIAPAGLALLTAAFPETARRAIAVMWWSTIGTAALAAGPILGGMLVHDLGWTSVFWAAVPLGLVTLVLTGVLLRKSRSDVPARFDPVGQILVTLFLAGLAFTLIEGVHLGWGSPAVLAAIVITVVAFAVLIPFERRHRHPLVPVTLFADRAFSTALTTAVLGYLALAGLLFLNTFYLQSERGLNATDAGFLTIPLALGATITAVRSARCVASGRSRLALILAGALIAVGSLSLWATEHAELWTIMLPYFVFGLGFGLIADPISVTALASLPAAKAGLASSLISTSKQVGQMLGIAGVGTVLALAGSKTTSQATEFDDMGGWVWALLAVAGVVIVVLSVTAPRATAKAAASASPSPSPTPAAS